jgi:hypothetical protein
MGRKANSNWPQEDVRAGPQAIVQQIWKGADMLTNALITFASPPFIEYGELDEVSLGVEDRMSDVLPALVIDTENEQHG